MAKKKQKGGRKPIDPDEKVILVGFYIKRKFVENIGGMDNARIVAHNAVMRELNKPKL